MQLTNHGLLDLVSNADMTRRPVYFVHQVLSLNFLNNPMPFAGNLLSDRATPFLAHLYASTGDFLRQRGTLPSHEGLPFLVANGFVINGNHVIAATWPYTTEGEGEPRLMIFMLNREAYQCALAADPTLQAVPEHIDPKARFFSINGTTADTGEMKPGPDFLVEWDMNGPRNVLGVVPDNFHELPVLLALVTEQILGAA
jgi:hypothetical protein